ncbi:MAG: hypothetical protein KGM99_12235 [Burkholderiales bacterium]|nr:hypothetical protein [Burkholderiales bacterium]
MNKSKLAGIAGCVGIILAGCGGFVYTTVGGNVSGLVAGDGVTLRNEGNYKVGVSTDGPFSFNEASNASYSISIYGQPNKTNCSVANGTGTMTGSGAVNNVSVTCVPNVPVSGTLSGLNDGNSIYLYNTTAKGLESLQVTTNSTFQFLSYVVSGSTYAVSVNIPPAGQYCTVNNATGTVDNQNLTGASNVSVNCVPAVPVKFTVSGLTSGSSLTLANAGVGAGDKLAVSNDGTYSFNWSLLNGAPYTVSVDTQPTGQTCKVTNGTGVADLSNPTGASNILVNCVKN